MLVLNGSGFAGVETTALNTPDELFRGFRFKIGSGKDPGTVLERMFGYDFTPLDGQTECDRTDAERLCRFC
jgi:hypothetical protein